MESRAKLFGHAAHASMVVFPLGLLASAAIFDLVALISGNETFSAVAYWNLAAGVVTALLAAIPGLVDWLSIPGGTRAKGVGMWHMGGNLVASGAFLAILVIRSTFDTYRVTAGIVAVELVLLGLLLVTGWLGGELVERLRVGVDDGAHLDAPHSMSGRPAQTEVPVRPSRRTGTHEIAIDEGVRIGGTTDSRPEVPTNEPAAAEDTTRAR